MNCQILGISLGFKAAQPLYPLYRCANAPRSQCHHGDQAQLLPVLPEQEQGPVYQSFLRLAEPADQPSWAIAGGKTLGDLIPGVKPP